MNPSLASLIEDCWDKDPLFRPSFGDIIKSLEEIMVAVTVPDKESQEFWLNNWRGQVLHYHFIY